MASNEQLVLDSLALNDMTTYRIQALDMSPPKKRMEWASGSDADGDALIRDPLFENRVITATLRIVPTTRDLAGVAIGNVVAKLEEAEKQPDGLDLVWTPADGTKSFTMKVLSGEVTEMPIGWDSGYLLKTPAPTITIVLTCKPFGYGPEVTGTPVTAATPFVTLTVASVTGDVPAEGRLIVTDNATQARRYMEWGLEQRYYNAATSLELDSDSMVVTGFAGTQTTRTGAYDPNATGNNVIRTTLSRAVEVCCGTGNLGHVGTFRVKARIWASSIDQYIRLSWQDGDGPFRSNQFAVPPVAGAFTEVDLGIISIPQKDLGTQRWTGRIEAYSLTAATTVDVDYLVFVPAGEGYGKARAVGSTTGLAFVGQDDFTSLGTGANLSARVAPSGGTWTTSGATTDFQGATVFSGTQAVVSRSTTADASRRFAILGSTSYTDVQAEIYGQTAGWSGAQILMGAIARWTDSSNYLYAMLQSVLPTTLNFSLVKVVAGVSTTLGTAAITPAANTQYGLRVLAYASGVMMAELRQSVASYAAPTLTIRASHADLATGGTLATGKPGFFDQNSSGTVLTRFYDWFSVATPPPEPIVINSTRAIEVRSDGVIRADSTNTYWGQPPAYRGGRFYVPPAGTAARTARVLVKAHRADIETSESANIADSLTAQVNYTPRYLAIPR